MGRYIRGSIDQSMPLGTLAAKDLIKQDLGDTVNERSWISSVKLSWTLSVFTPTAGVGPVLVGIAHSDYTAAEIEGFIEDAGSWDEGNLVRQEVAKRKIRIVGAFEVPDDAADAVRLRQGRSITTKCGWILNQGQTITTWVYNQGSVAIGTTDPRVDAFGHANLWPR